MDVQAYLSDRIRMLLDKQGQDLYLKVGAVPRVRCGGVLDTLPFEAVRDSDVTEIVGQFLNDSQKALLEQHKSVDFAFSLADGGAQRFRCNVFLQQGSYSMVIRRLWKKIPTFSELQIPDSLKRISMEQSGIILIAGTVGCGKTTTINAMINSMNQSLHRHIITIEDPVEYVHEDNKCLINQREIGQDARDFSSALKYVVRQSPDVIVIGEMRDAETFNFALSASEVGRLVISTVHAKSSVQIFERLLGFFPREQRDGVLSHLCFHIVCFAVQKLLVAKDGKTLVPAFEIMLGNETIRELVRNKEFEKIPQALRNARDAGMQTMDQSIFHLWQSGVVTSEEAMGASIKPQELEKLMKGIRLDEHKSKILGN